MTTVVELVLKQTEAKKLFDQTVSQKINEGYTTRSDFIAQTKAAFPNVTDAWIGVRSGLQFIVMCGYNPDVLPQWTFTTESQG